MKLLLFYDFFFYHKFNQFVKEFNCPEFKELVCSLFFQKKEKKLEQLESVPFTPKYKYLGVS